MTKPPRFYIAQAGAYHGVFDRTRPYASNRTRHACELLTRDLGYAELVAAEWNRLAGQEKTQGKGSVTA